MPQTIQAPMFVREMGLLPRLIIYALLSLFLMAADARYNGLDKLRHAAATVFHPLQTGLAWPFEYLGKAGRFFVVHADLLAEMQRKQVESRQLRTSLQGLKALESENARLRALLALPPRAGVAPLTVGVTASVADPFSRRLIVNRGSLQGVVAGRPVVDSIGLVGQVTRVFPASSEVTLLTSREQSAPVQNQRNGLRLIVTGVGSDSLLEVRYLDMHADLKPDDLLVTSGLDGVYPAGIPVARVLRIDPPRHTPFAYAVCQPIAGIGQNRHLVILQATTTAPTQPLEQPPARLPGQPTGANPTPPSAR